MMLPIILGKDLIAFLEKLGFVIIRHSHIGNCIPEAGISEGRPSHCFTPW